MKIMLVDDSKIIRNIQKGILAQLGHTEVVEAIKAGVNNYVVKPFTPEAFGARINETLKHCA